MRLASPWLAWISLGLIALFAACDDGEVRDPVPTSLPDDLSTRATSIPASASPPTRVPDLDPQSPSIPTSTPPPDDPSPTPPAQPGEPFVDIAGLTIPVCRTDPFTGGAVGFGTIPRAPAVASAPPDDDSSFDPDVNAGLVVAMTPVTRWLDHFTSASDVAWDAANDEQEVARALFAESRRLLLACNAVAAAASVLDSAHPFVISVNAALAGRRDWLVNRLEALRSSPQTALSSNSERITTSDALRDLDVQLAALASTTDLTAGTDVPPFTVPNPLLGLSVDVPGGWLLVRNRVDIVLAAPPGIQADGVRGLGVPGWNFGTALRIRRFRHEAPWTLTDTADLMDSLLARFGERLSGEPSLTSGLDTVISSYESPDDGWITIAAATVRDLQTYLFELGCPAEERAGCEDLIRGFLAGAQFGEH